MLYHGRDKWPQNTARQQRPCTLDNTVGQWHPIFVHAIDPDQAQSSPLDCHRRMLTNVVNDRLHNLARERSRFIYQRGIKLEVGHSSESPAPVLAGAETEYRERYSPCAQSAHPVASPVYGPVPAVGKAQIAALFHSWAAVPRQ